MKISIEAKVAAALSAALIGLTVGAIAQSQSSEQPPSEYAPSTSPSVNTHMGQRGYNDSTQAKQTGQNFADESVPSNKQKKSTKHKDHI